MSRAPRHLACAGVALAALAAATGTTVSAFAGSTSSSGNSFQAADSFCPSPGTATAAASADSWIDQDSPSSNFGGDQILKVRAQNGKANRALVRFALPATPANCSVTGATLRLYAASSSSNGRELQALRVNAGWAESGVRWTNQPATTGAAATTSSAAGWNQWSVTAQVQAMYSGANNGFLIRFTSEGNPSAEMQYHARDKGSQHPELLITFG